MVTGYHWLPEMIASNQLPRTKPIKVSRKRYGELLSIAKKHDCALNDALDIYIERRSEDIAKSNPVTIEKTVEKVVTGDVEKPISLDKVFEHMKDCSHCLNGLMGRGYVLISVEELKKHNLVPKPNPVCFRFGHMKPCECFL